MKKILLPGEKVADRELRIANTFIEDGKTYAAVVGTLDENGRYVPLQAPYSPLRDDYVVGIITDSRRAGYGVDINLPYPGFLPAKNTRLKLNLGDIVIGKVSMVDEVGNVDLFGVKLLPRGNIIEFQPAKVPRLIGRNNSMINLIKEAVGEIIVGNNGYIWVSENSNTQLLLKILALIIQKAHFEGLTDEVSQLISKEKEGV